MRVVTTICACLAVGLSAGVASAEFAVISDRNDFVSAVSGKVLSRPLVRLTVSGDGSIEGRGASWDVTGRWSWREGFFCRDLDWGGDNLGYNCQEVRIDGNRIRFTSDKGTGDSADFTLR